MHHAQLLVGSQTWAFQYAQLSLEKRNPDVVTYVFGRMSIDDARGISQDALRKPVEAPYRTLIICAESILKEAQNALLKLFEEPNAQTHFYLIIPREDMLLPTLRSRFHLLGTETVIVPYDVFNSFRTMGYTERLAIIAEKLKTEDVVWVQNIIAGYTVHAHKTKQKELMQDALMISTYAPIVGSAKKMLLEHIALSF